MGVQGSNPTMGRSYMVYTDRLLHVIVGSYMVYTDRLLRVIVGSYMVYTDRLLRVIVGSYMVYTDHPLRVIVGSCMVYTDRLLRLFGEGLRGLCENEGSNSIMKTKEPTRQVRDNVVEKRKAGKEIGKKEVNFESLKKSRVGGTASMWKKVLWADETIEHFQLNVKHCG
ncbi:unnamed protein product [Ranitomeya imitator]|uniref:Uncharacterized protein n=1 Tax=Ranitomeya imitator TaxID=111125 RepID=A0ABN9L881_9NEOB|nr:unnamed protein product [Ranitomeya imitator]